MDEDDLPRRRPVRHRMGAYLEKRTAGEAPVAIRLGEDHHRIAKIGKRLRRDRAEQVAASRYPAPIAELAVEASPAGQLGAFVRGNRKSVAYIPLAYVADWGRVAA